MENLNHWLIYSPGTGLEDSWNIIYFGLSCSITSRGISLVLPGSIGLDIFIGLSGRDILL
jgi:hypothetical protein